MQQNYQDAMAIVRKYGKPDFFITMTCNPSWREIKENLQPNQQASDRPDLVSRVFNLKLSELLSDLQHKSLLGEQLARVHVIEFQKRGLPHAHILLIVKHEYKPSTVEIIDRLVCAEIPDLSLNPKLHELVKKHMIHGPCGTININSPCMDDNKCTKDFPKQFLNETLSNVGGYPRYRRRNNGRKATVGKKIVDNRWIVPYNPYLLLKFNCHINIEVCATVKSVKYLFKYVYKGHDCANVEVSEKHFGEQRDEVKHFVESRYVSPPEAAWRLFSFKMHDHTHSVCRLQVHLPNQQRIVFQPEDIQEAVEKATNNFTTLTAWFKLNQTDSAALQYLYYGIPEHYVFKNISKGNNGQKSISQMEWAKRQRGGDNVIGRMYTVSLSDTERYCLRLLLLHIKGATSYDCLKTSNGVCYDTFKEAASALGLLDDDEVWDLTLSDALISGMPSQLRQLFALICVFSLLTTADILWTKYREHLSEDFFHRYKHQNNCDHCFNLALLDIDQTLMTHAKKCIDFKLPQPTSQLNQDELQAFGENLLQDQAKSVEMYASLNREQKKAFDEIYAATNNKSLVSKCFFLDGPGGTGKTYVYETLISTLRGEGRIVLPVASTGVAANLLSGGRTYHSQYKLPVPLLETSVSSMRINSKEAIIIKNADLLIWDESTMAPSYALNAIDRLLKEITGNKCPFGAKVLLLGGDFRQTLTVIKHGTRASIVETSIMFCKHWTDFKRLSLTENVRSLDPMYSEWLLKLGDGKLLNCDNLSDDIVEIPPDMLAMTSLAEEIFGSQPLDFDQAMQFSNRAILCPRNEDAFYINHQVLDKLNGEEVCYLSSDDVEDQTQEDTVFYPTEFLNQLCPSGMPPHNLRLKKGAIVMLLRNICLLYTSDAADD